MPDPAVRVEVRPDRVAVLTIDQPGAKVNVLTVALWAELEAAIDDLAARTDLAGVVIASGKPGCFIAGADLNLLATATPGDPAVAAFIAQGLRTLVKLEALPVPTCAAIDGVALGGGLEVALACDYRVCGTHPKVQLGLPEVKLGLIPGWGGTQRLPRVFEWDYAADMLLEGNSIDPVLAGALHLVTSCESSSLLDHAAGLLHKVGPDYQRERSGRFLPAERPAVRQERSIGVSAAEQELHHLLLESTHTNLADGIRLETEAFLRLAGSDESRAKIAAFFAARKR